MLQKYISKFLFLLWLRFSQFLGLILIEFDVKTDRFVRWKFSSIYCIFVGTGASIIYVIAVVYFYFALESRFSAVSFTLFVSVASEVFTGVFMVVSYQQQYASRYKICETLNNLVFFFRRAQKNYAEYSVNTKTTEREKWFFFSVLIKLSAFFMALIAFYLLTSEDFKIIFLFMSFPVVVAMVTCNQYFLGIQLTHFFLKLINDRIKMIVKQINFEGGKITSIETEIEKISVMHTKLFEFMTELSNYFGLQISFNIFNNVLNVTISAFQVFSTCLLLILDFDKNFNFLRLIALGFVNLFAVIVDIVFHLSMCTSCMKEVSLNAIQSSVLKSTVFLG